GEWRFGAATLSVRSEVKLRAPFPEVGRGSDSSHGHSPQLSSGAWGAADLKVVVRVGSPPSGWSIAEGAVKARGKWGIDRKCEQNRGHSRGCGGGERIL